MGALDPNPNGNLFGSWMSGYLYGSSWLQTRISYKSNTGHVIGVSTSSPLSTLQIKIKKEWSYFHIPRQKFSSFQLNFASQKSQTFFSNVFCKETTGPQKALPSNPPCRACGPPETCPSYIKWKTSIQSPIFSHCCDNYMRVSHMIALRWRGMYNIVLLFFPRHYEDYHVGS